MTRDGRAVGVHAGHREVPGIPVTGGGEDAGFDTNADLFLVSDRP